jgi:hypothetical protein
MRSEKTDFAMARTDQFLEDCFSQYEVKSSTEENN